MLRLNRTVVCLVILLLPSVLCKDDDGNYKPKRMEKPKDDGTWKKKDILDYSDADVEKLFDQWEEDEEELPVDELPPWEKEPPPINMQKVNLRDKDSILREGKRHRTLMMFATVAGNPTRKETEKVSARWESSLFNANIQMKRYVIEDDKILIQIDDGSDAVQIRDFLLMQEDCLEVTVDSKSYDGAGKKAIDKNKPLTKEEAREKKKKEAEAKAEREKIKAENKNKKNKAKKKKEKKDEL
ncbi:LDLR chaperone boca-like [Watersipora subatra]|uniref:LDLR chaperone boca-like n=1 Tax=Watersipora subatra TaxID=2589382 RepID=UPI00355C6DC0